MKACPNSACNNTGAYPVMPDGDAEQCQFCYEEPDSVFNTINKLTAENGRLKKCIFRSAEAMGKWLSAALEDPDISVGMKHDIQVWFDQLEQALEEYL